MSITGAAILMLSAGAVTIDRAHVERSARVHCAAKYPGDFEMQAACARNYRSGAESFEDVARRNRTDPAMQVALRRCLARYSDGAGLITYSTLGGCARNQERRGGY